MSVRALGGLVAVTVLFALCAASARADDACWNLLYATVKHNAAVPHSPYVTYSERVNLQENGESIEDAHADVTYRDDGLAYVDDSRFVHPFVSLVLDPGPPVLGPYGDSRQSWLAFGMDDANLPVIASTKTAYRAACSDLGDDTIDGGKYAHLVFPDSREGVPGLKAVWIDRNHLTMRRVVVAGYINFNFDDGGAANRVADYTLEVRQIDGHDVLDQVNWNYTYKLGSQRTNIKEEYKFDSYQFSSQAPAGTLFASTGGT